MLPDIQHLIELQALDLQLADLRGRVSAIPKQLAEIEKKVADGRQQLASSKEALTTSLKDRKRYEMDVDSWKEKAKKYRDQSFEVKTNEAYKALQHEAEHAQKEMSQAEDRLLDRMVAGEEFERQVKGAERVIVELDRIAASEREKLNAQQSTLSDELKSREAERQKIVAEIPESLLRTYEGIARRRHGIALAEVKGDSCAMCGMLVRPHVVQELRRADSDELFQCETCTRIFYYVEPPPDTAQAAISAHQPGEDAPAQLVDPPGGEG